MTSKRTAASKRTPRLTSVSVGEQPLTLTLHWQSGEENLVNVAEMVGRFRIYVPLQSHDVFRQLRLGEYGTDVVWTETIDMAATTLWRLAQEQSDTTMTRESSRYQLQGSPGMKILQETHS